MFQKKFRMAYGRPHIDNMFRFSAKYLLIFKACFIAKRYCFATYLSQPMLDSIFHERKSFGYFVNRRDNTDQKEGEYSMYFIYKKCHRPR